MNLSVIFRHGPELGNMGTHFFYQSEELSFSFIKGNHQETNLGFVFDRYYFNTARILHILGSGPVCPFLHNLPEDFFLDRDFGKGFPWKLKSI